jgi:hypothetical protein
MRQLGAQSLRLICQSELPDLGPKATEIIVRDTFVLMDILL